MVAHSYFLTYLRLLSEKEISWVRKQYISINDETKITALSIQLWFGRLGSMQYQAPSYQHHRLISQIISHPFWRTHRFCLSFREVEELVAERGITVTL